MIFRKKYYRIVQERKSSMKINISKKIVWLLYHFKVNDTTLDYFKVNDQGNNYNQLYDISEEVL